VQCSAVGVVQYIGVIDPTIHSIPVSHLQIFGGSSYLREGRGIVVERLYREVRSYYATTMHSTAMHSTAMHCAANAVLLVYALHR
jgi:hypothetical protein